MIFWSDPSEGLSERLLNPSRQGRINPGVRRLVQNESDRQSVGTSRRSSSNQDRKSLALILGYLAISR